MNYTTKRHIIKIPKNVATYYCDIARIVIFANSSTQKALTLKTKLVIDKKKRMVKVTREPFLTYQIMKKRN